MGTYLGIHPLNCEWKNSKMKSIQKFVCATNNDCPQPQWSLLFVIIFLIGRTCIGSTRIIAKIDFGTTSNILWVRSNTIGYSWYLGCIVFFCFCLCCCYIVRPSIVFADHLDWKWYFLSKYPEIIIWLHCEWHGMSLSRLS